MTRVPPTPALLLAAAAVAGAVIPGLGSPSREQVTWIVSVALVAILFDGGMQIGRRAAGGSLADITVLGVAGTVLTTAGVAVFARLAVGLPWYDATLLAAAVAPTDPAVVFSVLGDRPIAGRSAVILKGESGANDPVGIALMVSLVDAGRLSGGSAGPIVGRFALQLGVGVVVGMACGELLRWAHRQQPLARSWLEPARAVLVIAAAFALAHLVGGSGFLAVFIAGILLGDEEHAPMQPVRRSFDWLSSVAEIVAFVVLGLTVSLHEISRSGSWGWGLAVAAVLTVVIRPAVIALCLARLRLRVPERVLVAFAGLKGAVPILLANLLLGAPVGDGARLYSMIVIVVMASIVVQGGALPLVTRRLRLTDQV